MRWAEHVACMVEGRGAHRILVGKPERNHLEDLGVNRVGILKWVSKK
jgi:hypothetical protein